MRLSIALVAATLALVAPAVASPTSRLTYVRGPGAEACPDESVLRRAVADRLGYDPFFPAARRTVVARVERRGGAFRADLQILDDAGVSRGERELPGTLDCGEVVKSLALAISIALDDLDSAPAPPPPEEPAAAPPPPTPPPKEPEPPTRKEPPREESATKPPPEPGLTLAVEAAGFGSSGAAPAPSVGGSLGLRLAGKGWSTGLEGRLDAAASDTLSGGGRLQTSRTLAVGRGCVALDGAFRPFACALFAGGSLHATPSEISTPRESSELYVGAGARLGFEVIVGPLYLFGAISGLGSLTPHHMAINGSGVYSLPIVALDYGLGIGVPIFR